jgi:hypothetical protein
MFRLFWCFSFFHSKNYLDLILILKITNSMRAFLLTAVVLLACTSSTFAQNLPPDYFWEVGFNAGYSYNTRPLGPANAYQGTRTNRVNNYGVNLDYYFSPHWMINLDVSDRKWESFGTWQLNDKFGKKLQTRNITFVQAYHAVSESICMNYVVPFYTRYNNFNRANLYFGAMLGFVTTVNDGSIGYSKYNAAPDSNYKYASKYDYGYGFGMSYGVQMGYTYYVIPRLGINVEVAARYAHVNTNDEHYNAENKHYYLLYFPGTLGIRWRF